MKRKGLIALLAAVLVTMSMAFVSADESDFKLVNSYPKDGQTNTSIENVGVKLRFNRELAGEKAQKNNAKCVKIVDPNGKEIPIKVMSSKEDKGLLLVLGDSNNKKFKVENNAKYKLVISENLMDDQGDRLGKETTLSFTTFNQRLNMMINMGMMFLIFGGITVMTIRNANQQQEKKNKKDEKEEAAFNPYHEAKRTGKTVEEVIAENKKKEEKIKELQEFISRFSANASKSKQATSRKRALEKIQLDDMRPSSRKYPYIDFRPNREIGNEVLMVENLSKTIDGVKVLDNISFTLGHDDKVAFVGANEQAITTLFKILVGEMEPDEGNYKWGVTTSQAYFPKDNTAEFDNDLTITDWLTQYSEIKDATYVRGFLGRMLFPGEDGIKRVRVLSGGEKVRCLLSKMMISGANILILDEPTNHLDMESITALNNGLIKFPGVILFTSHDHQFVQTTANRIMEILPNGTMIDKITTYDEYLASDEMAKKRHVFEINEEDASDN